MAGATTELLLPSSADPERPSSFADLLVDFFRIFCPERVSTVDGLVRANAHHMDRLFAQLESEYHAAGFFATFDMCFHSRFFDPRRVLYNKDVIPPVLLARPLDNLHQAQSLLPSAQGTRLLGVRHTDTVAQADARYREGGFDRPSTFLDFWADTCMDGPLGALRTWYLLQTRVRVVVRPSANARGPPSRSFVGVLRAFDKHWNLLLSDVKEEGLAGSTIGRGSSAVSRPIRQLVLIGDNVVSVANVFNTAADRPFR